jgi:hypothetical protein
MVSSLGGAQVAQNDPMNIHGSSGWTSQMVQMSVFWISMGCPNDRPIDAVKGLSHVHPWDGKVLAFQYVSGHTYITHESLIENQLTSGSSCYLFIVSAAQPVHFPDED